MTTTPAAASTLIFAAAVAQRAADSEAAKIREAEHAASEARRTAARAWRALDVTTDPAHPLAVLLADTTPMGDDHPSMLRPPYAFDHHRARFLKIMTPLTPAVRSLAEREARARVSTSPGWTGLAALEQAVTDILNGCTPALDTAAALMAYDPTGHKAAHAASTGRGWDGFASDATEHARQSA